jgi:hypothetical protein
MVRKTAMSVIAASAVLFGPGSVQAQPTSEQVVQVVADSAAETYRQTRGEILQRYRDATRMSQRALASATDLDRAWHEYKRSTADASQRAHHELLQARETFRRTVSQARGST